MQILGVFYRWIETRMFTTVYNSEADDEFPFCGDRNEANQ